MPHLQGLGCWLVQGCRRPHLLTSAAQTRPNQEGAARCQPPATPPRRRCPLTIQDVKLVRGLAETWGPGLGSGVAGPGRGGGRGGPRETQGHSPYLGKNRVWSSVRLAPWTRCSNTLRNDSLTGSERAVCGTHGAPGRPLGGCGLGGQGALGAGLCAGGCDLTPAPHPRSPLCPHIWA